MGDRGEGGEIRMMMEIGRDGGEGEEMGMKIAVDMPLKKEIKMDIGRYEDEGVRMDKYIVMKEEIKIEIKMKQTEMHMEMGM